MKGRKTEIKPNKENMPFLNQWETMTVEIISWSISMKIMWPDRDSNSQPLDSQSDTLLTALGGLAQSKLDLS